MQWEMSETDHIEWSVFTDSESTCGTFMKKEEELCLKNVIELLIAT